MGRRGRSADAAFICEAAKASLDRGETFYTAQRGVPELREAIAAYMTRVYGAAPGGVAFSPENFFVTIGGMHAIEIATRLIVGPGDEALIPSPAWPNFVGALEISGARAVPVRLDRTSRWSLDPDKLASAVTPATRAHFFQHSRQSDRLRCDARGDRCDARASRAGMGSGSSPMKSTAALTYDGARAPSFHDVMAPDDKIMFVQTLSKNWAMTGFRVGWLEAPRALGECDREPGPVHHFGRAGLHAARRDCRADRRRSVPQVPDRTLPPVARYLVRGARATGRVRFFEPEAAFYLFCAVDGFEDSRALAFRLIDEAGVGPAPGGAFGPGGDGHLRLCFARDPAEIAEATRRMARWLKA